MCAHNMLLLFHSLVCSWTVQLALGTALMSEYLCDNIGLGVGMSSECMMMYNDDVQVLLCLLC